MTTINKVKTYKVTIEITAYFWSAASKASWKFLVQNEQKYITNLYVKKEQEKRNQINTNENNKKHNTTYYSYF